MTADLGASLSFDGMPFEPRSWPVPNVFALGEVTVIAGPGESWKGLNMAMFAALFALGLPVPGRPEHADPARVLWVSSGTEDDPIHDLSGRFRGALDACAEANGLDPAKARRALRYIHNLSEWDNGAPIEVPGDLPRIRAEVARLNDLDASNRPRLDQDGMPNPDYTGPGPQVVQVVFDPLDALLGPGATVDSRPGARRVMGAWGKFARGADVSACVLHHTIETGSKIAGSPAVVNSVRLAFIVKKDPGNDSVRVLTGIKSNVSDKAAVRYVKVSGLVDGHVMPHVMHLDPEAAPAASAAAGQVAGETLRDRIRSAGAAGANPVKTGGSYRVLRKVAGQAGSTAVPGPHHGRGQARAAAEAHASRRLTWTPAEDRAGMDTAAYRDGDTLVSYGVVPMAA